MLAFISSCISAVVYPTVNPYTCIDTMELSGSFWDNADDGAEDENNIQTALVSPMCSIEALLGYDEFLQELRTNTHALVEFVSRRNSLQTIVSLITEEPPEDASEARCYKLPFIANEAICLSVEGVMKNFFLDVPHPSPLSLLWNFLDNPKPLNPVLSGYFHRSMDALLNKNCVQFIAYLRDHPYLVDKLFSHFYSHSISGFFQKLICNKLFFEEVIAIDGITTYLLQQLFVDEEDISNDIYKERSENVTSILLFLFALNSEFPNGNIPLIELTSNENMNFLLDLLFSG
ncbi:hypothetical protein IE077_002548, partial [Cardiosporidium cionae]